MEVLHSIIDNFSEYTKEKKGFCVKICIKFIQENSISVCSGHKLLDNKFFRIKKHTRLELECQQLYSDIVISRIAIEFRASIRYYKWSIDLEIRIGKHNRTKTPKSKWKIYFLV